MRYTVKGEGNQRPLHIVPGHRSIGESAAVNAATADEGSGLGAPHAAPQRDAWSHLPCTQPTRAVSRLPA